MEIHVHAEQALEDRYGTTTANDLIDKAIEYLDYVYYGSSYSTTAHYTDEPSLSGDTSQKLDQYRQHIWDNYNDTSDKEWYCLLSKNDTGGSNFGAAYPSFAVSKVTNLFETLVTAGDKEWIKKSDGGFQLGIFMQEVGHMFGAEHLDGEGTNQNNKNYTTPMLTGYADNNDGYTNNCGDYIEHVDIDPTYHSAKYWYCAVDNASGMLDGEVREMNTIP